MQNCTRRHSNPPRLCAAVQKRRELKLAILPSQGHLHLLCYICMFLIIVTVYKYFYSMHIFADLVHSQNLSDLWCWSEPFTHRYYYIEFAHQSLPFSWHAFKMFSYMPDAFCFHFHSFLLIFFKTSTQNNGFHRDNYIHGMWLFDSHTTLSGPPMTLPS